MTPRVGALTPYPDWRRSSGCGGALGAGGGEAVEGVLRVVDAVLLGGRPLFGGGIHQLATTMECFAGAECRVLVGDGIGGGGECRVRYLRQDKCSGVRYVSAC